MEQVDKPAGVEYVPLWPVVEALAADRTSLRDIFSGAAELPRASSVPMAEAVAAYMKRNNIGYRLGYQERILVGEAGSGGQGEKLGRWLTKHYEAAVEQAPPDDNLPTELNGHLVKAWVEGLTAALSLVGKTHVKLLSNPDNIYNVYNDGEALSTCMEGEEAVRGYGDSPNARLAVLRTLEGKLLARAVVNEDTRAWVRVHGESQYAIALRLALRRKGYAYKSRAMDGLIVRTWKTAGDRWSAPYIDGSLHMATLHDNGDGTGYWTVCEDGDWELRGTGGYPSCRTVPCASCGTRTDLSETICVAEVRGGMLERATGVVCRDCIDGDKYIQAEDTERPHLPSVFIHRDYTEMVLAGQDVVRAAVATSAFYREHTYVPDWGMYARTSRVVTDDITGVPIPFFYSVVIGELEDGTHVRTSKDNLQGVLWRDEPSVPEEDRHGGSTMSNYRRHKHYMARITELLDSRDGATEVFIAVAKRILSLSPEETSGRGMEPYRRVLAEEFYGADMLDDKWPLPVSPETTGGLADFIRGYKDSIMEDYMLDVASIVMRDFLIVEQREMQQKLKVAEQTLQSFRANYSLPDGGYLVNKDLVDYMPEDIRPVLTRAARLGWDEYATACKNYQTGEGL